MSLLVCLLGGLVVPVGAPAAPQADRGGAEAMLRRGDVAGALTAAERAAAASPRDLDARELYYDLLVATGQGPRARAEIAALAAASPNDADLQYLAGRVAADPAASRSAFQAALGLAPGHARATMGLGSLAEARGDWAAAAEVYAAAAGADPTLSEAWLGLVRCRLRLGDRAGALTAARTGLANVSDEPGLALVVADLAPAEAPRVLRDALARVPDEPRLHEASGKLALAGGDAGAALKAAHAAQQLDPTSVEAARLSALAREVLAGSLDAAGSTALQAALAKGPLDPRGTMTALRALATKYPRSASAQLALGSAKRAAGDTTAIDDLVRAAQLDPRSPDATGAAGLALLEVERYAQAEPLLQAAMAGRPWDPAPGLGLVRIYAISGRTAEAHTLAEQLAARFPTDPGALVTHAGFLVDRGDATAAYELMRRAMTTSPDPRVVAALVRIAPLAGHPDEAAALLEQIVEKTGNTQLAEAARKLRAQGAPR